MERIKKSKWLKKQVFFEERNLICQPESNPEARLNYERLFIAAANSLLSRIHMNSDYVSLLVSRQH